MRWLQWQQLEGVCNGSVHVAATWFHLGTDIAEMKKVCCSLLCNWIDFIKGVCIIKLTCKITSIHQDIISVFHIESLLCCSVQGFIGCVCAVVHQLLSMLIFRQQ